MLRKYQMGKENSYYLEEYVEINKKNNTLLNKIII